MHAMLQEELEGLAGSVLPLLEFGWKALERED